MLKKLSLIGLVLAASSSLAMADNPSHHHKKHCHHKKEVAANYKGEVVSQPVENVAPAHYSNGPYLGISLGDRVNYTTRPALYNGLEGNLSLGYAFLMQNYYLAGEVYVGDSVTLQNSSQNGSARSTYSYGISFIPGILISDTVMGYLRIGVLRTNFTANNSNETGGQLGLGMQTALTQAWDLRGEYIYNVYNSVSSIGTPRAVQFNLGLVYKI